MKRSRLTNKQIQNIRDRYWDESELQIDMAIEFDCNQGHLSRIVNGLNHSVQDARAKKYSGYIRASNSFSHYSNAASMRKMREQLHSTKLTYNKAQEIRKLYYLGTITQMELAAKYKVNQSTICKLVRGQSWKKPH